MPENVHRVPPLLSAGETRRFKAPVVIFGLVIASIVIARLSEHWQLPFMKCAFKSATGLPCVTCGGTRALRALSRGAIAEAFWLNPLVITGACASLVCLLVWMAFPEWSLRAKEKVSEWPWFKVGILLALLNWIYLVS